MNMMNRWTLLKNKGFKCYITTIVCTFRGKNTLGSQNDSKQFFNTFLEYNNQKNLFGVIKKLL